MKSDDEEWIFEVVDKYGYFKGFIHAKDKIKARIKLKKVKYSGYKLSGKKIAKGGKYGNKPKYIRRSK